MEWKYCKIKSSAVYPVGCCLLWWGFCQWQNKYCKHFLIWFFSPLCLGKYQNKEIILYVFSPACSFWYHFSSNFSSVLVINGALQGAAIKLSQFVCCTLLMWILKEHFIVINSHEKLHILISCTNKYLWNKSENSALWSAFRGVCLPCCRAEILFHFFF